jgi:hypothetical protein
MSESDQERLRILKNALKDLEKSKATHLERRAYFREKLAYIDNPAQEFELKKRIELGNKDICNLDIEIASVNKEIEKIESKSYDHRAWRPEISKIEIPKPTEKPKDDEVTPSPEPSPPEPSLPKPSLPKGNYAHLRELLDNEQWKEAYLETTQILLQIAKRQKEGWLKAEHIKHFFCADLNMIDQLWSEASQNKFGFKAQMTIWAEIIEEETEKHWTENFRNFGDIVGWRVNDNWLLDQNLLQFSLNAPRGHLPSLRPKMNDFGMFQNNFKDFLLRLETCL